MGKRVVALILIAVMLAGCTRGGTDLPREGYTFTDSLGREVTVDAPQRVAAVMGGFADTWILAGGELAAVTDDAIADRELQLGEDVVNLGFYSTPSTELLLSSEPDLVLLSSETRSHVDLAGTLDAAGIPAAYFEVTHFSDYLHMLDICTDITGRKDLYRKNGVAVGEEIEQIIGAVPEGESPTILLLITHSGGPVVQNGDTMTGRMLAELGCHNLADENPSLLKDMSMEYIIDQDPDFIFVIPMGNSAQLAQQHLEEIVERDPAWADLSAVEDGRYILLPKEGFLYKPNARWADSYRHLYEVLYGQG